MFKDVLRAISVTFKKKKKHLCILLCCVFCFSDHKDFCHLLCVYYANRYLDKMEVLSGMSAVSCRVFPCLMVNQATSSEMPTVIQLWLPHIQAASNLAFLYTQTAVMGLNAPSSPLHHHLKGRVFGYFWWYT